MELPFDLEYFSVWASLRASCPWSPRRTASRLGRKMPVTSSRSYPSDALVVRVALTIVAWRRDGRRAAAALDAPGVPTQKNQLSSPIDGQVLDASSH